MDDIINKLLEIVILASALSEQKIKKNTKEKFAVEDNLDKSSDNTPIIRIFTITSKIIALIMTIYLMYINNKINLDIDSFSQISSLLIFIYAFIANIIFQQNNKFQVIITIISCSILFIGLVALPIYINRKRIWAIITKKNIELEKTQTNDQKIENKTKAHRYYISILLILTGINQALVSSNVDPLVIFIMTIIRFIATSLYLVYLKRNGKIQFDRKGIDTTATANVGTLILYISNMWDYLDSNDAYNNERNGTIYSMLGLLFLFFLYGLYNDFNEPIELSNMELSGF
jgi:hypothetical protein